MAEANREVKAVIIGGGPAGLTAGRELIKFGHRPTVLEKTAAKVYH